MFGKTIEGIRQRKNVQFITDKKQLKKCIVKPSFKEYRIFNPEFVAANFTPSCLTLNKPVAIGFTVLELSKLLMYKFHYEYIIRKFGLDQVKLIFTDTDSLCYEIQTDDIYEDFSTDTEQFDFSDYPSSHPLFSKKNKKVMGKFKDETNGDPIKEVCAIKPKMYSYLTKSEISIKKAKGITATEKKKLRHQDYKDCILESKLSKTTQTTIQSRNHDLYTWRTDKITLNPVEDKRYLLRDGIKSVPYFHYGIPKKNNNNVQR